MFSLILTLSMMGQCSGKSCGLPSQSYYSYQSYYTSPQVYYQEPALHLEINNVPDGVERSRRYVKAILPDGYTFSVPIINGVAPVVRTTAKYSDGSRRLSLDYSAKTIYKVVNSNEPEVLRYAYRKSVKSGPTGVDLPNEDENVKKPVNESKNTGSSGVDLPDETTSETKLNSAKQPAKLFTTDEETTEIEQSLQRLKKPSKVENSNFQPSYRD